MRRHRALFRALFVVPGALAGLYVALFLADVGHQARWIKSAEVTERYGGIPGLYTLDPSLGYMPTPGFSGEYPEVLDGHEGRPRKISINSRGHREPEPTPGQAVDTLLVGDSFTFGALVDQDDVVSHQATRLSGRHFYGAGCGGYDAKQVLTGLRKALKIVRPSRVVYLFYENDLAHRERVYRLNQNKLEARKSDEPWALGPYKRRMDYQSSLALTGLRGLRLPYLYSQGATHEDAVATVALTLEMEATARAADAHFSVFRLPTVVEVATGQPFAAIDDYVAQIQARGVEVLTCELERSDFFDLDQHCNARGNEKIARALVAATGREEMAAR
jgi:hypothetical protein